MEIGNDRGLLRSRLNRLEQRRRAFSFRWLGRTRRKPFHQFSARAFGDGIDEMDDSPNAFGDRLRLHVEIMRPRHGHMCDRLVHLEKLQAARGKLLAQDRRNLQRKAPLLFL